MSARYFAAALLSGSVVCFARGAQGEAESTAWLTDVSVAAQNSTETRLAYEHQQADIKAPAEGIDVAQLGLQAGLGYDLALAPEFAFSQRGEEPLRLESVGLELRWRILERVAWPELMLYGAYRNDLGEARDHLARAGLAACYAWGPWFVNGDMRPTLNLGGDLGTTLESFWGLAAGYALGSPWHAWAGLEGFVIVPLVGERLRDPSFGQGATSSTAYLGPSLGFEVGPFWTSASAVTGYLVSTQGSQFMLRWLVGVAHD